MTREGKQSFKVIDTDKKWILYHNCFSLCSRKVRLCLEELEIEYDQEHIDLIETGKYQVASKNFLKINPGATVPVLLHKGYPIYEFNYKNDPTTRYRGVMAHDLVTSRPDAIHRVNGYLAVDYSKLDVDFEVI